MAQVEHFSKGQAWRLGGIDPESYSCQCPVTSAECTLSAKWTRRSQDVLTSGLW